MTGTARRDVGFRHPRGRMVIRGGGAAPRQADRPAPAGRSPHRRPAARDGGGDPASVRDPLRRAFAHLLGAIDLTGGGGPRPAWAAGRGRGSGLAADLLVTGFATVVVDGYEAGVRRLREAVDMLLHPAAADPEVAAGFELGFGACQAMVDDARADQLLRRAEGIARRTGAQRLLQVVRQRRLRDDAALGRPTGTADQDLREQLRAELAATDRPVWYGPAALARTALARIEIAEGRYAEAGTLVREVLRADVLALHTRLLPELVEAAARSGDPLTARAALRTLATRAAAAATPLAWGLLARSSAVLAGADRAEALYRDAIGLLASTRATVDLARAHLLYGEWLRRCKRRAEARERLRVALAMFEAMPARPFARRARTELAATGEHARVGPAGMSTELTPRERAVAALAAGGATNAEIAARLFISPNTVDYHLRKVFRKLGVPSRRRLGEVAHRLRAE